MIRITSRKDGFRRCGVVHPATPVEHSDDRFTEEELKRLMEEPMLVVEVISDQSGNDESNASTTDNEDAGTAKTSKAKGKIKPETESSSTDSDDKLSASNDDPQA